MATVLMGKGGAALQKVGFVGMTPVSEPRIDLLGLYPSMQTIIAQTAIVTIIALSVVYNLRSQKRPGPLKSAAVRA